MCDIHILIMSMCEYVVHLNISVHDMSYRFQEKLNTNENIKKKCCAWRTDYNTAAVSTSSVGYQTSHMPRLHWMNLLALCQ